MHDRNCTGPGQPESPVAKLWKQIITKTECKLIITTGTAGGIGAEGELGDDHGLRRVARLPRSR